MPSGRSIDPHDQHRFFATGAGNEEHGPGKEIES